MSEPELKFGTLFWKHPIKKQLEFIVGKKAAKGNQYSLFYHTSENFAQKFYGDLLGLVGSFANFDQIIKTMPSSKGHQKTYLKKHNYMVYYVYLPYDPFLLTALNGFKNYLNQCKNVTHECKTYPYSVYSDFAAFDATDI